MVPFTVVLMVNGDAVQAPYSQTTAFRSEGGLWRRGGALLLLFDFNVVNVRLSILTVANNRANDGGFIAVCLSVLGPRVPRLFLENNRTLVTSAFVRQCNSGFHHNCEKTDHFKENHLLKRIGTLPRPVPETQRGGGVTIKGGFQARRTSQCFNSPRTYLKLSYWLRSMLPSSESFNSVSFCLRNLKPSHTPSHSLVLASCKTPLRLASQH